MSTWTMYRGSIFRLNRNMRLYVPAAFFMSLAMCINDVLYNLYLRNLSFSNAQMGEIEAMRFWASLIFAIPCGLLSDRLGRKRSMLIGGVFCVVTLFLRVVLENPTALMLVTFLYGVAYSLTFISVNPFVAEQVEEEDRMHIYSLLSALYMGAGVFGYSLGGFLPDLLHGWGMNILIGQRLTLALSAVIFLLTLLPICFIREQHERDDSIEVDTNETTQETQSPAGFLQTMRHLPQNDRKAIIGFSLPIALSGIGSALVVPLLSIYLTTQYQVNSTTVGIIQSAGEFSIVIATILGPAIAQRFGLVKSVTLLQILSVPFLLLMGNSPWLGLAVVGFLARGALMNAVNPLQSTLQMNRVSVAYRGFVASCVEMAFSLSRALFTGIGGSLSETYGFPALYSFASLFYIGSGLLFYVMNKEQAQ